VDAKPLRRVLMISPHFPPDSSAAAHRVRLLAPHLPQAGWHPTVVTVAAEGYEGRLDPGLASLVPPSLAVVRAPAWSAAWTRRVGIGDLGIRAFAGLRRVCRDLLGRMRFDAVFITIYPVYPALLGPPLKRDFSLPFILDYQDPWVGEWGRSVGGAVDGSVDWKSRVSRRLGEWLEPEAVRGADALVAVSQGTIDGIVERVPEASRLPHDVIPVGFDAADFDHVGGAEHRSLLFDGNDGNVHLVYVGTLLPTGVETLRLLLTALARARALDREALRLRLHFIGTSNQSVADRCRVVPIARECGVDAVVTEHPARLAYFDALRALTAASGILLLGNTDAHYTASKLFPALLARRPLLALYHHASSVVSMLAAIARQPSVRVVTYTPPVVEPDRIEEVAAHLIAFAHGQRYDHADVSLARAEQFSAPVLARRLADLLDRVAA
jgi:hypothetical protein